MYCFSETLDESGRKFIKLLSLIDFIERKQVECIPTFLVPSLKQFAKEHGIFITDPGSALEYYLPLNEINIENLVCPSDMEFKQLTLENADEVNDFWVYKSEKSINFKKLLIKNLPSIGLFKKNGGLIGWCLM